MKIEKRGIGKCILLTLVTCGIYGIVWILKLAKEMVQFKDPNDSGLVEILLMLFLAPVGRSMAEKQFAEVCQEKGIAQEDHSIL